MKQGHVLSKLSAGLSHHILILPFMGSLHWAYFLNKPHLLKAQSSVVAEFPAGSPDLAQEFHPQPW